MSEIDKITGNSPEAKSLDITQQNIEQLKQLFPDVFSENKIDFEALKAVLGEEIDDSEERYNFSWNGKAKARQIAQTPSTGTLRPCKEESVNWDTTENLFIEGDNLEVLKLLQKSYHKKVKMIYIDPPYNTGKDFVYKDDFKDNIQNYLELTGQVDNEGNKLSTNSNTSGRYHSAWLSMMYPRLKLAKNLLAPDGVMYISIDETEVDNLKKICLELFGESAYVETIVVQRSANGMGSKLGFSTNHDYILVLQNTDGLDPFKGLSPNDAYLSKFAKEDKFGKYKVDGIFRKKGQGARRQDSPNCFYPVYIDTNTGEVSLNSTSSSFEVYPKLPDGNDGRWIWSKSFAEPQLHRLKGSTKAGTIYVKDYLSSDVRVKPRSIFIDSKYLTDKATNEITGLFGKKIFSTPKPVGLIYDLIENTIGPEDIVLDFFAGSCTTAQALTEFNTEKELNAKFILVQIPEEFNLKNEEGRNANDLCEQLGVKKNLCSLGIERLKRVNDFSGVKIFKLDETNIRPWDADFDNLELVLQQATESIKADRSSEDVLYEIFLKYGYDLTTPVDTEVVNGKTVFIVGAGALIVCLDDEITGETVEGIAKLKEELDPETTQVVFKDAGFADSNIKTNAIQILKQAGIDDVKSI
ncbi:site-specific DNA-methyltransferase [Aliivibrio finisterrensis]|uniref:site-specific DNA-methyltransferase (adenine-specific) n=1 Tax=Aliivibrio finisterrensis TaxID=511998 RepID=A0ABY0I9K9_9GAMM|nr:site-specific DNA-methyltransferase [Aliivibrio finisterrensis]RYU64320.1 site-specific DNA-methyltransferase [Aliivibrio finisterrensis]RYU83932.1 site-specific DNA-methyltransferase [Aliivibrio finisterrensis]